MRMSRVNLLNTFAMLSLVPPFDVALQLYLRRPHVTG